MGNSLRHYEQVAELRQRPVCQSRCRPRRRIGLTTHLGSELAPPHDDTAFFCFFFCAREPRGYTHAPLRRAFSASASPMSSGRRVGHNTARSALKNTNPSTSRIRTAMPAAALRAPSTRRRTLLAPLPPVRENLLDQLRILEARDYLQPSAAARALLDLDPEDALQTPGPVHANVFRRRRLRGGSLLPRPSACRRNRRAQRHVRREYAMKPRQVRLAAAARAPRASR